MSVDLATLISAQRDIHGRMSRSVDNLKKLGASGINPSAIETRIEILDQLWAKFQMQHESIRSCYKEKYNKSEYATEFFDTVENTYVQQRSTLSAYADRYKTAPSTSTASNEQQTGDHSMKTALPLIKLPQFSGSFEDWPSFRDLFLSVIGDNSAISKIERLHYLRSCLQGPAERLIWPLSVTGENYDRAWALLKKHFENKKELIRSNFAAFTAVNKIKGETAEELSRIYHAVTTAVNAQESIARPINSHGMDLFNFLVVQLFDSRTRLEWEASTCDSSNPPNHDVLLEFITKRMLTLKAAKKTSTAKTSGVYRVPLNRTSPNTSSMLHSARCAKSGI
ncbi:uncharacterized protein LOC115246151 [Formica exsecta]|uniref:uncharacterized protein LOC115246151 n=1 Tax=Formica exsecta TaxID=72781 RepID=UPI0011445F85|nr:uncharacterized protein LOC115246151 [Formica exsecta]